IAEDFYKRIFRKDASSKELLFISRMSIFIIAILAYFIAASKNQSIFNLVSYAWFGLGSSFGPLLIFSLYSKTVNRYGAWAGILSGGGIAAIWPVINSVFSMNIPTLIPAFGISCLSILVFSRVFQYKEMES
ncbi:MAG: sodium/proline symporter, partial [Chlamydiales bacterium]|nr:sodium/proline symporter [Chlamydiales bacterium]